MKFRSVLLAALLLAPTAALAAPGMVTVSTGLRAGPGSGFPLVDRVPERRPRRYPWLPARQSLVRRELLG